VVASPRLGRITEFMAVEFGKVEVTKQSLVSVSRNRPWQEGGNELKQCWTRPDLDLDDANVWKDCIEKIDVVLQQKK
ncbi:hypothetical protein MKW98_016706, partial [Papaver atlanticum]